MRVSANGLSLAYDDRGAGIPVLFIHGYPLNRQIWQPQLAGLADVARVLALDLPGHGESQAAPGPYGMDRLADACNAFLDGVGLSEPVVVCGLSMGGYVAMAFYRQYGPRAAGLILAATRAGADTEEGRSGRDKSVQLVREKGPQAIAGQMLPKMLSPNAYREKPGLVEQVRRIMEGISPEAIEADLVGMRDRPDSYQTLAEASVPLLIIHGADDQIMPVDVAKEMQAANRGAALEIIPEAGHLLNLEQPERFNAAVRSFLEQR